MSTLGGKKGFRQAAPDTDAKIVLAAIALAPEWMNCHPECTIAAWLMSGVVTEEDYIKAGMQDVLVRAQAALKDPQYHGITTEYKKGKGIWDTSFELLLDQVCDALDQVGCAENKQAVSATIDDIPWLVQQPQLARTTWHTRPAQSKRRARNQSCLVPSQMRMSDNVELQTLLWLLPKS